MNKSFDTASYAEGFMRSIAFRIVKRRLGRLFHSFVDPTTLHHKNYVLHSLDVI
jgi:hypothetical protein